jgi:hypothetical protein
MDRDGQFYDEPSANSKYAFIVGEMSSQINISSKSIKGNVRQANTPCRPGSYFIQKL